MIRIGDKVSEEKYSLRKGTYANRRDCMRSVHGRNRSEREITIFKKNEMIYHSLGELQKIAMEEREYDPIIVKPCPGHDYEYHVTHYYNKGPSIPDPDGILRTISVQEKYCFICGHYAWTACMYGMSSGCDESYPISEKL